MLPLSPSFTFGVLLATLYGALAHLILGGGGRRLVATILAAWIGFAIGQGIGDVMDLRVITLGPTNVFSGTLGALIAIAATTILAARRDPGSSG